MRAIFWPTTPNPNPTAITRLGRVLHWIAVVIAALFIVLIIGIATNGDSIMSNLTGYVICLFWAGVFAMGGRGLRYILSGE